MEFTGNTVLVQPFQDLLKELKKVYFENKQYVDHNDDNIQPFTDITTIAPIKAQDIRSAVQKCADQFQDRSSNRKRMMGSKNKSANQRFFLFLVIVIAVVVAILVPIGIHVANQNPKWGLYLIEQGLHLVLLASGAAFVIKLIMLDRKYDKSHSIPSTYHEKVLKDLMNLTTDSKTACSVSNPESNDGDDDTCPASNGNESGSGTGNCPFSGGNIDAANAITIADNVWKNRHELDQYDVVDSLFDLKMDVMTLYEFVATEYDDAADQPSLVGQDEYISQQLDTFFSMNYMAMTGYKAIITGDETNTNTNDDKTCFEKCLTSDTCAYASYDTDGNCTTATATSAPFTLSLESGVKTLLKSDFEMNHSCGNNECSTIDQYMENFSSEGGSEITLSPANLTGTELAMMYQKEPIRSLLVNRFANIFSKFGGAPVSFESYKDRLRSKIRDGWPALNQTFDALVAEGKFLYDLNKESASKSQRFIRFERFHEKLNGLTTEQAVRTLYTPITHISRTANYMANHDVNKHIIWMRYDYYVERFSHINFFAKFFFSALFGYFMYYTYIINWVSFKNKDIPEKILDGVIVVLFMAVTAFVIVLIHGQYTKKAQTTDFNKEIVNKNGQQFMEHAQELLTILKKETIQRQTNIEACLKDELNEEDEVNHMELLLLACRKKPAIYNKPIHIVETYDVSELYSHIVGLIETYEKCNNIKLSAAVSPPFPLMDVVVYTILIVFVVAALIYLFVTYNVIDLFQNLMEGKPGCGIIESDGKGHQQTVTIVVIGVIVVVLLLLLILRILESSKQTLSGLQASRYAQEKRCCNT